MFPELNRSRLIEGFSSCKGILILIKENLRIQKTMKLNNSDYKNILKFYKIDPTGLSNQIIKERTNETF